MKNKFKFTISQLIWGSRPKSWKDIILLLWMPIFIHSANNYKNIVNRVNYIFKYFNAILDNSVEFVAKINTKKYWKIIANVSLHRKRKFAKRLARIEAEPVLPSQSGSEALELDEILSMADPYDWLSKYCIIKLVSDEMMMMMLMMVWLIWLINVILTNKKYT